MESNFVHFFNYTKATKLYSLRKFLLLQYHDITWSTSVPAPHEYFGCNDSFFGQGSALVYEYSGRGSGVVSMNCLYKLILSTKASSSLIRSLPFLKAGASRYSVFWPFCVGKNTGGHQGGSRNSWASRARLNDDHMLPARRWSRQRRNREKKEFISISPSLLILNVVDGISTCYGLIA